MKKALSFKLLAVCALLGSAASGFAATTWTPGKGCTDGAQCTTTAVGSTSSAVTGVNDAGTTSAATTVSAAAYAINSGSTFANAKLYDYGSNHLGVLSGTETAGAEPQHAMDNSGATELISLKFTSSVALTSIQTAYASGDSDMSLLAYTGAAGYNIATYDVAGKTIGQLLSQGWTLVANIDGAASAATYAKNGDGAALNASGISSSWWLVSAFNSSYGGSQKNVDGGDDYIKLLSVAGNVKAPTTPGNSVPEPGSLALMGAAFWAAYAARRKASKSV